MSLYGSIAKAIGEQSRDMKLNAGAYTATAADATANAATIDSGLSSIDAISVMILRSDVPIFSDQDITVSGGNIVVADGAATYAVTAGDVIHWIAVGS